MIYRFPAQLNRQVRPFPAVSLSGAAHARIFQTGPLPGAANRQFVAHGQATHERTARFEDVLAGIGLTLQPASSVLTIAAGEITLPFPGYWPFFGPRRHTIAGEGGAADSLAKINGGYPGELLVVSASSDMVDITAVNSADIILQANFILDSINDTLMMECVSASVWREVGGRCNNG